jgi:hypothetical protein
VGMIRFIVAALIALTLGGAAYAQKRSYEFVAAPDGDENGECTDTRPCSPQGAVNACPMGAICGIELRPGIYLDPAVDIYYHRTIAITGDCADPYAVIFRATKRAALVWIQDHAIGIVKCLALEATVAGGVGISGRQHIIADYERVIFGPMPEGTHVGMTECSIASCMDAIWITGDAAVHAGASDHSKLNLGCYMTLTEPRAFTYFVSGIEFSIINCSRRDFRVCRNWYRLPFGECTCAPAGSGVPGQRARQLLEAALPSRAITEWVYIERTIGTHALGRHPGRRRDALV